MAHPDNVIKALKDEVLFVDRWQCKWGFHRWSSWSKPGNYSSKSHLQQQRVCSDCGRVQIENVKGEHW